MTALVRTRMFRLLACLVIAMTFAATGLEFVHARLRGGDAEPATALQVEWLRAAGDVIGEPDRADWGEVELVTVAQDDSTAQSAEAVHFRVDASGQMRRTAFWEEQTSLDRAPKCVRVAVVADAATRFWSARQRLAVTSLLAALNRSLERPQGEGLPVHGWPLPTAVASAVGGGDLHLTSLSN